MRTKRKAFLFIPSTLVLLLLPSSILSSILPFSCDTSNPSTRDYPFCEETLPIDQRVDDLVARLSLKEKISQLGDRAPPIPRLGLPGYKWWSEALHGVSDAGRGIHYNGTIRTGTSFPQVILTAASFNPLLWYRIGEGIGTEARALYNAGQAEGLTFWAPNINIFRDPRWGRGQETPGEDPLVTSKYAISYVRGVQGDSYQGKGGVGLKASACCKHFTAYDLDRWNGVLRYSFNAKVSAQDLEDTYQPPFKSCVEQGHASGIMCSYNQVNGVPTCADYNLLTKTARGSWGFHGYITSDCDAVSVIYTDQKYSRTPEDAVAITFKAGMDVNCGDYVQKYAYSAIKKGKLSENDINRALHNLFTIRMRLGLFNGSPRHLLYGSIASNQVCSPAHQNLALEAARDGIVLLKNLENILPLSRRKVSSIGVIGPNANRASILLGNYNGPPCKMITPFQVLQNYAKDVRFVAGCDTVICNRSHVGEVVRLASSVDYVVLFMGLDQTVEREDFDREHLLLPGMQKRLITSVARVARKPVILVLFCGGPVDVSFVKNNGKIGAVLWGGYPGEAGGVAIAEVIFGKHNPGGRLPLTWYPQEFTRVPMTDMRMRADKATRYPGRTYRFYTGNPVFEFGHGLTYSIFSYKFKSVAQTPLLLNSSVTVVQSKSGIISYDISKTSTSDCEKFKLSALIEVENHGPMDGKHSVLVFLRRPSIESGRARKQLVGFESVSLKAGERKDVEFGLKLCEHFVHIEEDGRKVVDEGSHFLVVGTEAFEFSIMG